MHQDDFTPSQFVERRKSENEAVLLLIADLQRSIGLLDKKFTHHHDTYRAEVRQAVEAVHTAAFPDGDPEGHRRHHELVIQREEVRVKFWNEMMLAGAKWMGLGVLGFVGTAIWIAFKTKVNQ